MKLSIMAIIAATVQAEFADDASVLIMYARSLSSVAQTWNRRRGLSGALSIQRAYIPVSAAVERLAYSSQHYSVSQANAEAVEDLSAAVAALLNTLSSKAGDLQAVGAVQLAANDIGEILDPTELIVSNIYENVMHDSEHLSSLSYPFYEMEVAFEGAASALGAPGPNFPVLKAME